MKYRALILVVLLSSVALADQTRTVTRSRISVGDLVPDSPASVASIDLGPSPPPGGSRVISKAEISQQIVAAGFSSSGLNIPDTVRIVGASRRLSGADLVRMATPVLERSLPSGVKLVSSDLPSELVTPPEISVKNVNVPRWPRQKGQFHTTATVELASEDKIVARVSLPIVLDISEQAARPDVQRGALLTLVIESPTVRISTQATSMSDGNIGETLNFQVKSTGRVVSARLQSPQEARIVERP